MKVVNINRQDQNVVDFDKLPKDLTEWDQQAYLRIISTELTPEQKAQIIKPEKVYPGQDTVLAVHWHPEFIPMELIEKRINAYFPNRTAELIIPTQHNIFTTCGHYTGVEIDCYSKDFNRKVQLLLHFENSRIEKAYMLKTMLEHTYKYRSSQLFELIHSITDPKFEKRLEKAVSETGADHNLVIFTKIFTGKLEKLLINNERITSGEALKNKILINYFDQLSARYGHLLISRAKNLITVVKKIVKAEFSHDYFYATEEIIEETRALGGGIVVPHPEQFWPILLVEYDVDGYEVWNPQSREYTEFLINVLNRQNKCRPKNRRKLLAFMGDDTHMSEKIKRPEFQDPKKASRQVGIQTAWDDPLIRKSLIYADTSRPKLIEEYKSRLE